MSGKSNRKTEEKPEKNMVPPLLSTFIDIEGLMLLTGFSARHARRLGEMYPTFPKPSVFVGNVRDKSGRRTHKWSRAAVESWMKKNTFETEKKRRGEARK